MKTTREQAKKTVMRSPRRFGKSTLITDKFLSACEKGESVEFRHPKYICMSLKRLQHLLDKEREVERDKTATKILSMMSSLKYQRTWSQNVWTKLRKKISTLKPKENNEEVTN